MISNERQLKVAMRKHDEILKAMQALSSEDRAVLERLGDDVRKEIDDYVSIRNQIVNVFKLDSFDDLGQAVIRARVARGWTQRELAERLGVSEQMVQKDEHQEYENIGLSRLGDILDVLNYDLTGSLNPTHLPPRQWAPAITLTFDSSESNSAVDAGKGFELLFPMHTHLNDEVFTLTCSTHYPVTPPSVWYRQRASSANADADVVMHEPHNVERQEATQ